MKKIFLMLLITFSFSAYADQTGICKDQKNFPSSKFRCWYGTDGNDLIQVFGNMIKISPYDDGVIAFDCVGVAKNLDHVEYGTYDKKYTNVFYGLNGADRIEAGDGDDIVFGGPCNDYIQGGNGNDFLYGGGNIDVLYGMAGNDSLFGGSGKDFMTGGPGVDTFYVDQKGEDPERYSDEKEYTDTTKD